MNILAWAKRVGRGRCPANEPAPDPDAMRVVSYRRVAPHVYEVTTESRKYGRVTQRVLVLPDEVFRET